MLDLCYSTAQPLPVERAKPARTRHRANPQPYHIWAAKRNALTAPASLPQLLGAGYSCCNCCTMAADTSTARMSSTPRARRCGMRQPVPDPTSSTRLQGPRPGSAAMMPASRCNA
eukprot:GHRQ01039439.1.p2 GENE.GHRQ01039439.1~~GHRQ01039439.1.p2  ORF type:complete len:115 (-),score=17.45 GHRQ01039439.1:75-419(-)